MAKRAVLDRIDRRRYPEHAPQRVIAEIMSNDLALGDKLPEEKEPTEEFNVSRTVVREALRRRSRHVLIN